jgi:gluconate 2-dehydrogenase alpha chain
MATGVTFMDSAGNEGEQPADIVVVSAYQLDNVRLLLLSGIGKPYNHGTGEGVVGRAYNFQTLSWGFLWFDKEYLNPFINTGAMATQIDDFNGDNFDHTGLGFIGGAGINALSNTGLPIGLTGSLPKGRRNGARTGRKPSSIPIRISRPSRAGHELFASRPVP